MVFRRGSSADEQLMRLGIGLLITISFIGVGLAAGMIRPELLQNSLEEQYTPTRARGSGLVALLTGLAYPWPILDYDGGPSISSRDVTVHTPAILRS